jgi:hypothetical protein
MMASETMRCRFATCGNHPQCGVINGIEISLPQLGDAVRYLQKSCKDMLHEKIICGADVGPCFFEELGSISDALQNKSKDFWFGVHPKNARLSKRWEMLLWNHRSADFWCKEDEKLNVEACNSFLSSCETIQKKLLALCQLTGGSPSRASEIATTRIVNDAVGTRNLFLSGGMVVLASTYTKTRSMNNGLDKPIARFHDAVTSGLLLTYLTTVRPLEGCIVSALESASGGDTDTEEHRIFMFSRRESTFPDRRCVSGSRGSCLSSSLEGSACRSTARTRQVWLKMWCAALRSLIFLLFITSSPHRGNCTSY